MGKAFTKPTRNDRCHDRIFPAKLKNPAIHNSGPRIETTAWHRELQPFLLHSAFQKQSFTMTSLTVQYYSPLPLFAGSVSSVAASSALGIIGLNCLPSLPESGEETGPVRLMADLPLLWPERVGAELWLASDATSRWDSRQIGPDQVVNGENDRLFFGAVRISNDVPLREASFRAYQALFSVIDEKGFPHLLKTANYMPRIHDMDDGTERYHLFNQGRFDAFSARGREETSAPAACALGTGSGGLLVYVLAGRQAGIPVENPRQISAYRYPEQYGPRSPTFSRATIATTGEHERCLFISGTAAITGHQSLHPDDVEAQTWETVANIRAVMQAAQNKGFQGDARALRLKAYIRHPSDLPAVQSILNDAFGPGTIECILRADICRAELLVEVEGYCPER
ncbi:Pteridine-dependent dioxygenase [Granulibacter bethesdensis]|uniref:Pteridine-dependent dioxygenase n=2 Tax=Granulibacter bethesdensis TaxID=364410 RepID=A0AAN0RDD8_9PROT|nr:Pteridine-dependent dioxygenase [Granulibacter bethesdensis]